MDKAEPVHPGGCRRGSWCRAFRTAAPGGKATKAKRAHQMVMGTRRWVHSPRPSRLRTAVDWQRPWLRVFPIA